MLETSLRLDGVDSYEADSYVCLNHQMNVSHSPAGNCTSKGCRLAQIYSIVDVLKASSLEDHSCFISNITLKVMTYSCKRAEENVLKVTEREKTEDAWSVS